jgi:hydrogenase-4 component F
LMSGVLLAVAMYAIARWKVVVDIAAGQSYSNHLLLTLGLLSVVIATFSVVHSRYYKRLLAYSSIEHTGLICIGLALGPLGVFAAMLHLINHTLVKSMLFVLSGRILHRYESTEIKQVTGLLKILPGTGVLFAVGMLALMGLPPFGLFVSEFALIRAGFVAGQTVWMVVVLILLAIAFVAFARHLNTMLYGPAPDNLSRQEADGWQLAPLAFSVAALVILGLTMPTPLYTLLNQIVEIIG